MRRLLMARSGGSGGAVAAPANASLTLPVRAAYYFPWYPEVWTQHGYTPYSIWTPALGLYDQHDVAIIDQHMAWAKYAKCDAVIVVWEGRTDGVGISGSTWGYSSSSDAKLVNVLDRALAHGLKVAILYEVEGVRVEFLHLSAPTAVEIGDEFTWLASHRFNHPAYLHVGGKPVVIVYSANEGSNATCARYSTATSGFTTAYVILETISSTAYTPAPSGWMGFDSTVRAQHLGNSYTISPGSAFVDGTGGVLARDLSAFTAAAAAMVASGADWQLITTFNEWGEGSAIEPTTAFGTDYLDALAGV